jgi:vacuolar iron transporter family protein
LSNDLQNDTYLRRTLVENWRREMEATELYRLSAEREPNPRRREIFKKLEDIERKHARMWEEKLRELGFDTSALKTPNVSLEGLSGEDIVERIEAVESGNATWYQSLRNVITDDSIVKMMDEIEADEADHAQFDAILHEPTPRSPEKRITRMWKDEKWHKTHTSGWVGDVIYGVNDGLGAIFGIIAGVAGYTASDSRAILMSGLFGALASTLSMGAGAWLSTKSENELMESEIEHERREIEQNPEHEMEELALLYQLKGFSEQESMDIARKIASDPEQFLETMAREELGFHEATSGSPWKSALFGGLSTFVGGIIPLIPFFFMAGLPAMITAAVVSLLAHFAVGAAKSLITVRSWWTSGLEMTLAGVIVGVVSYVLGMFGSQLL